jgi:hypothetical protein
MYEHSQLFPRAPGASTKKKAANDPLVVVAARRPLSRPGRKAVLNKQRLGDTRAGEFNHMFMVREK